MTVSQLLSLWTPPITADHRMHCPVCDHFSSVESWRLLNIVSSWENTRINPVTIRRGTFIECPKCFKIFEDIRGFEVIA